MTATEKFDEATAELSPRIRRTLSFLPDEVKRRAEEIRLRRDLPVSVTVRGKSRFVTKSGGVCGYLSGDLLIVTSEELSESFLLLCRHSVYDHAAELSEGYIRSCSGNRVGVCGSFNEKGALSDVSSLNIRVAHEVIGCGKGLMPFAAEGMLLAGPPCSGKTTLLRDLVRGISEAGERVAVIDSRGEISGGGKNRLGANTDVIRIANKAAGVEIALRTLFPNVIAFDEIGTRGELQGVSESFCAGVRIITTAHTGSAEDLLKRPVTAELLRLGAVKMVAVLSEKIGEAPRLYRTEELI